MWGQLMLSLPCVTPRLGHHTAAGVQSGAHVLPWPVEHLICVPAGSSSSLVQFWVILIIPISSLISLLHVSESCGKLGM